jgi:hypothetical protein
MIELPQKFKDAIATLKTNGLPTTKKPYEKLVQDYIAERYSLSDEIAIINNYNHYKEDPTLVELKQEYDAYQAYRAECKRRAREKTKEGEK